MGTDFLLLLERDVDTNGLEPERYKTQLGDHTISGQFPLSQGRCEGVLITCGRHLSL